jgi:hypothetical protein
MPIRSGAGNKPNWYSQRGHAHAPKANRGRDKALLAHWPLRYRGCGRTRHLRIGVARFVAELVRLLCRIMALEPMLPQQICPGQALVWGTSHMLSGFSNRAVDTWEPMPILPQKARTSTV